MVYIYFYQDNTNIFPPAGVTIQHWNGELWVDVGNQRSVPDKAVGNALNIFKFDEVKTDRMRVILLHPPGKYSGLYEIEFYRR